MSVTGLRISDIGGGKKEIKPVVLLDKELQSSLSLGFITLVVLSLQTRSSLTRQQLCCPQWAVPKENLMCPRRVPIFILALIKNEK